MEGVTTKGCVCGGGGDAPFIPPEYISELAPCNYLSSSKYWEDPPSPVLVVVAQNGNLTRFNPTLSFDFISTAKGMIEIILRNSVCSI